MWKSWLQRFIGKTPATADTLSHTAAAIATPSTTATPPDPSPLRDWTLLITSWSGFDREAGLRAVRSSLSAERLAAIIVRLNDWVPQVRAVAREAFEDYLTPQHAGWLVAQMPAILALEHRHRDDHRSTINKLEALLATPECVERCAAGFDASRGSCARLLFRVFVQTKVEDEREAFLVACLHHVDFSVRRLALGKAMELEPASAQRAIAFGLASKSSILRRQSFLEAIRLQTGRTQLIEAFLLDPSPAARSTALWAAGKYGVDPLQMLQAQLAGELPATKARWLGLLGLAQDLKLRIPEHWMTAALSQSSGAVRSLVLMLEGEDNPERLIAAVAEPARAVFEAGVLGLRTQPWSVIGSPLTHQLDTIWATLSPTRRLALLELMPKWSQAGYLLKQLDHSPCEPSALEQLSIWVDTQPYAINDRETPKDERDRIVEQLKAMEAARTLPAGSVARLI